MRVPVAVTVGLTALSCAAAWLAWSLQHERAQSDFEFRAHEITERVRVRMRSYEQVLRGGAALFAASEDVSREDWNRYVASLDLAENYPGFQGIGYSMRVPAEHIDEHIAAVRSEGFPDYAVYPPGERDEYHTIVYLEPFDWRNQRAFGFDMSTEPRRHAAMRRARDTGTAALSAPVRLVQETETDVQAGFNLYVPVYRDGAPLETVEDRRAALAGFVYSPFRMNDLLHGMLGAEPRFLRFEIHDAETGDAMYESSLPASEAAAFARDTALSVAGRTWRLRFSAPADFGNPNDQRRPWFVLAFGLVISLLAGVAVWAMRGRRQRGEAIDRIVDSALDGVVIISHDDRILEFNPAAERLFGWRRGEVLGRRLSDTIVPTDQRDAHLAGLRAYVQSGQSRLQGRTLETDAVRRDGTSFPVEISITRVGSHEPPTFSGFIRDVSERRDRQLELERLNAQLEQRVAERTHELEAFVYSVSHDLRSPLRAVDGFSAELERQYSEAVDDPGRHYIARIRSATHRMGQLIEDLLGLSRMMQVSMTVAEVDLSALARTVVAQLQAAEPARVVDVRIHDTEPVTGDARLLRVLLENLLGNAWKFSSRTDGAQIEFGCETRDGQTVYFVRDNGAGFDTAYSDRMFAPFQRLHTDSEFPGTGIGLATVSRVVQRHAGRIWAESEVGRGATFWFTVGDGDA